MIRYSRSYLSLSAVIISFCLSAPAEVSRSDTKIYTAYSMRSALTQIETQLGSIDTNGPVYSLAGISRPKAVVISPSGEDVILLGEVNYEKRRLLSIDDWAVALQAQYRFPTQAPGVTIELDYDVRFFAGIENTRFGSTCFEADILLKKIGLGLEVPNIPGLRTLWRQHVEELRRRRPHTYYRAPTKAARFWYYPIVNDVTASRNLILLEKFKLGILSESISLPGNNQPSLDELMPIEYVEASIQTKSLNDNFSELVDAYPAIRRLKALTRLAALAKGLLRLPMHSPTKYFVNKYQPAHVETPKKINKIVQYYIVNYHMEELYGGVSLEVSELYQEANNNLAISFAKHVLSHRKAQNAVHWKVPVSVADVDRFERDGAITNTEITGDPKRIVGHAIMLYKHGYSLEAVEQLDRVLAAFPNNPYCHAVLGTINLNLGNKYEAYRNFTDSIDIFPSNFQTHFYRGLVCLALSHYSRAVFDFNNALSLNPTYFKAHYSKALACDQARRFKEALASYRIVASKLNRDDERTAYARRRIKELELR